MRLFKRTNKTLVKTYSKQVEIYNFGLGRTTTKVFCYVWEKEIKSWWFGWYFERNYDFEMKYSLNPKAFYDIEITSNGRVIQAANSLKDEAMAHFYEEMKIR